MFLALQETEGGISYKDLQTMSKESEPRIDKQNENEAKQEQVIIIDVDEQEETVQSFTDEEVDESLENLARSRVENVIQFGTQDEKQSLDKIKKKEEEPKAATEEKNEIPQLSLLETVDIEEGASASDLQFDNFDLDINI